MRRRGTAVSREALYEEVWTDAVTVAPRYDLLGAGAFRISKMAENPAKVPVQTRR